MSSCARQLSMPLLVVSRAEPANVEALGVIVVVRVNAINGATSLTRFPDKLSDSQCIFDAFVCPILLRISVVPSLLQAMLSCAASSRLQTGADFVCVLFFEATNTAYPVFANTNLFLDGVDALRSLVTEPDFLVRRYDADYLRVLL